MLSFRKKTEKFCHFSRKLRKALPLFLRQREKVLPGAVSRDPGKKFLRKSRKVMRFYAQIMQSFVRVFAKRPKSFVISRENFAKLCHVFFASARKFCLAHFYATQVKSFCEMVAKLCDVICILNTKLCEVLCEVLRGICEILFCIKNINM